MNEQITLNLNSVEVKAILDGLLQQAYDNGKKAEEYEESAVQAMMVGNTIGEQMRNAKANRARLRQSGAYSAYNKIAAEAMKIGLIH